MVSFFRCNTGQEEVKSAAATVAVINSVILTAITGDWNRRLTQDGILNKSRKKVP